MAGAMVRSPSGGFPGVLILLIDPEREFTEILQRGRIGASGESYAFNREGQLVSESRFDDDLREIGLVKPGERGILNIDIRDPGGNMLEGYRPTLADGELPLTLMARNATEGSNGSNLAGYNDYRGVPVVGAWLWNEDLGYGITTEMDVAEAYKSVNDIRQQAYFTILFSVALLLALTGVFVWGRVRMAMAHDRLRASERRVSEQLAYQSALLQNAADGIVVIDDRGIVQTFSPAAERIFGYRASEVVGQNVKMLTPEPIRSEHDGYLHRYLEGNRSQACKTPRDGDAG